MHNFDFAKKELQRLQDIGKIKWDSKKQKWNKDFYPVTDEDNNFIKWKFGKWQRLTCLYCHKLLQTREENPYSRQTKFCSDTHQKNHSKIISRAKKKFDITDKTRSWFVLFPPMYEFFIDKSGILRQRQVMDRIESRNVEVVINGKRFPYTTKKGKNC